jgi:endonuclease/exonuclease/phosphatase family metal-dependent hydrolase
MRLGMTVALLWAIGVAAGCRTAVNYTSSAGPRYAGYLTPHRAYVPASIRVVTFNIQFARHIDSAIALLQSSEPLVHADIITLQEMDASGTRRIAAALGMSYVYYPATLHPATGRDFGNAILSRWPITEDAKILLPHLARFRKSERIATAATIRIGPTPVRVYSVHLGTMLEEGPGARRDQVRVILADAAAYPRVIVGGDMNNHGIGREFLAQGYGWPTEHNPHTEHIWNWDHVFLKGLAPNDNTATGVVRQTRHASDHHPVWAVLSLVSRGSPQAAATGAP